METRTIWIAPDEFSFSTVKRDGPWAGEGAIRFSLAPRKGWVPARLVREGAHQRIAIVRLTKPPTEITASVAERPEEEPTAPDETIYT